MTTKTYKTMTFLAAGLLVALAPATGSSAGRPPSPVRASEGSSFERNSESFRQLDIANDVGAYIIGLSGPDSPPGTRIGLPQAPHHHNFPPWDFLRIKINGISMGNLKPKSVQVKEEGANAGWEMVFNFNGVYLNLFFFMRPASPVLWCRGTLQPLKDAVLESAELNIICFPSLMIDRHFDSEIYDRTVFTPARILSLADRLTNAPLSREDQIVIFSDRKHPAPEGYGPCAIALDWRGLADATVSAGRQCYVASTILHLAPATRSFVFGVFKSRIKYTDQEFLEYIKKFPNDFSPPGSNSHFGGHPLPSCPAGTGDFGETLAFSPNLLHSRHEVEGDLVQNENY